MRALVESYLNNLCLDENLVSIADDARVIERKGRVPEGWWETRPKFTLPGFDNWLEAENAPGVSQTPVALGRQAAAVMEKLCCCYRVKPEHVMRAIVESYMVDLCRDEHLLGIADDARVIACQGRVPDGWWTPKHQFAPPGFENL